VFVIELIYKASLEDIDAHMGALQALSRLPRGS